MQGNNTLILNSATIIEALQEYFDKRSLKDFDKITSFNYSGGDFVVRTTSRSTTDEQQ